MKQHGIILSSTFVIAALFSLAVYGGGIDDNLPDNRPNCEELLERTSITLIGRAPTIQAGFTEIVGEDSGKIYIPDWGVHVHSPDFIEFDFLYVPQVQTQRPTLNLLTYSLLPRFNFPYRNNQQTWTWMERRFHNRIFADLPSDETGKPQDLNLLVPILRYLRQIRRPGERFAMPILHSETGKALFDAYIETLRENRKFYTARHFNNDTSLERALERTPPTFNAHFERDGTIGFISGAEYYNTEAPIPYYGSIISLKLLDSLLYVRSTPEVLAALSRTFESSQFYQMYIKPSGLKMDRIEIGGGTQTISVPVNSGKVEAPLFRLRVEVMLSVEGN